MNARGHSPLGTKICLVMSVKQDGLVNMEEIHNTKMELNRMLAVEEDILSTIEKLLVGVWRS